MGQWSRRRSITRPALQPGVAAAVSPECGRAITTKLRGRRGVRSGSVHKSHSFGRSLVRSREQVSSLGKVNEEDSLG